MQLYRGNFYYEFRILYQQFKKPYCSRIQSSIEDTIAFTSPSSETKDNPVKPPYYNQEPVIVDFETDRPVEEVIKEIIPKKVVRTENEIIPKKSVNDSQSNQTDTIKESTKEPETVMDAVAGSSRTTKLVEEEDLETFLFGKSPAKSKPPPKKKFQQHSLKARSQSTIDRTKPFTLADEFDSPPSSQYPTPGLTFESTSCSPLSRQRDLLSVARDIAALQKVVASGKKLSYSVSVSDTIKFTNQVD